MKGHAAVSRIPLPAGRRPRADGGGCAGLVAEFLDRTEPLPCEEAAALAGVRVQTIRRWRRRLPRWLKAVTSRRISDWLREVPRTPVDGLRRAFHRVLRTPPEL